MQRVENYLKLLLQGFGAVTAIALVPFVMPRSWMAMVHEWLGMGVLPDKPVVEYLARTTSALYGLLGGLYLVLATDVRRFARAITYSAVATLLISAVNTALCLRAGMPTWWMWSDMVACWLFGLGILLLQRRADSLRRNSGPDVQASDSFALECAGFGWQAISWWSWCKSSIVPCEGAGNGANPFGHPNFDGPLIVGYPPPSGGVA